MTAKQFKTLTRKLDRGVPVTDKELEGMCDYADMVCKRTKEHGGRKREKVTG